eukprot:CAMPEP_0113905956 /NCGR_PEP_ID=MMETSP0780_2-20120614/24405_1 /TAXON_ID=652834 /ORGANISM="Palpitomonas bilix" /LENGTH=746 /DNA_ID=CAMNT_0000900353 /DNA_START=124 /DNA_END=2364 /DNA_ORIENTATION=+ /assembly_acc=CAM_ASM_000599
MCGPHITFTTFEKELGKHFFGTEAAPASTAPVVLAGRQADEKKPVQKKKKKNSKKSLYSGKPVWNKPWAADLAPQEHIDGDPGVSSDEEHEIVLSTEVLLTDDMIQAEEEIKAFKKSVEVAIREYFDSGDLDEVGRCIDDLSVPELNFEVVKRSFSLAIDRKDREKEMSSVLLSYLFGIGIISGTQMVKGFAQTLDAITDLTIDYPSAENALAKFVCRAIIDEILPPSFLDTFSHHYDGAVEEKSQSDVRGVILSKAKLMLGGKFATERFERAWGAATAKMETVSDEDGLMSGQLPLDALKEEIRKIIDEYFVHLDNAETGRALWNLDCPHFHHEMVKQLISVAIDRKANERAAAPALLSYLGSTGLISHEQIAKGLTRLTDKLDDLMLDAVDAHNVIAAAASQAFAEGVVSKHFVHSLPKKVLESSFFKVDRAAKLPAPELPQAALDFKEEAIRVAREYLVSHDLDEAKVAVNRMKEQYADYLFDFVRRLVIISLDMKGRDREAASQLLSALYGSGIVTRQEVAKGFSRLLDEVNDLCIDAPFAKDHAAAFIARCVYDDILPPSFTATARIGLMNNSVRSHVLSRAHMLISRAIHRLENVWTVAGASVSSGAEDETEVERIQKAMKNIIKEYLVSHDVKEACRSLEELEVPHFHHEFVYRSLVLVMEGMERDYLAVGTLFKELSTSAIVSSNQFENGLRRLFEKIDDLLLDAPKALGGLKSLVNRGFDEKWFPSTAKEALPATLA